MQKAYKPEKNLDFFISTILEWFEVGRRNFKWRKESDPYKILIAEIMLQRTRAEQVEPIYSEFINKFKNITSLANSRIEDVRLLIKILGLPRRSEIFIQMAKHIFKNHRGIIPSSRQDLLEVPGIGEYIADAMIVYAFGGKTIAVDTNVVRIISRFYGVRTKGEARRDRMLLELCQSLQQNLDPDTAKKLNWALIDFPALICKTKPLCIKCPLASKCAYLKRI